VQKESSSEHIREEKVGVKEDVEEEEENVEG